MRCAFGAVTLQLYPTCSSNPENRHLQLYSSLSIRRKYNTCITCGFQVTCMHVSTDKTVYWKETALHVWSWGPGGTCPHKFYSPGTKRGAQGTLLCCYMYMRHMTGKAINTHSVHFVRCIQGRLIDNLFHICDITFYMTYIGLSRPHEHCNGKPMDFV